MQKSFRLDLSRKTAKYGYSDEQILQKEIGSFTFLKGKLEFNFKRAPAIERGIEDVFPQFNDLFFSGKLCFQAIFYPEIRIGEINPTKNN